MRPELNVVPAPPRPKFVWIAKQNPLLPRAGDAVYSNGILRGLLESGARGTLVAYARSACTDAPDGLTVRLCDPPLRMRALSLFSDLQSDAFRFRSSGFAQLVERVLADPVDVIFIDYFAMGWVLPVVMKAIAHHPRRPLLVYVSHNFEQTVRMEVALKADNPLMRHVLMQDARKAARLEQKLMRSVDLITAITEQDKAAYEKVAPSVSVITLKPGYGGEMGPLEPLGPDQPRQVALVGSFDWIAKRHALKHFLAAAEGPFKTADIRLLVVGKASPSFIREITAQSEICRFTGSVEDIRPHLRTCRLGVMPDEAGGGFKLKHLDYIFAGLPIVTIRSQCAGLPLQAGAEMVACDSIEEMVKAVIAQIDDIPRLEAMRRSAWTACRDKFNWSDSTEVLLRKLSAITDSGQIAPGASGIAESYLAGDRAV